MIDRVAVFSDEAARLQLATDDGVTIRALAESVVKVASAIKKRQGVLSRADADDAKKYLRRAFADMQRAAQALDGES